MEHKSEPVFHADLLYIAADPLWTVSYVVLCMLQISTSPFNDCICVCVVCVLVFTRGLFV